MCPKHKKNNIRSANAGLSVIESMVAFALLSIFTVVSASAVINTFKEKRAVDASAKYLEIVDLLDNHIIRQINAVFRASPPCTNLGATFDAAWINTPFYEDANLAIERADGSTLAPLAKGAGNEHTAARKRCIKKQTTKKTNDLSNTKQIYFCLVLEAADGVISDHRSILSEQPVFAEVFYTFYDVTSGSDLTCTDFVSDLGVNPQRMGKVFYTVYWQSTETKGHKKQVQYNQHKEFFYAPHPGI